MIGWQEHVAPSAVRLHASQFDQQIHEFPSSNEAVGRCCTVNIYCIVISYCTVNIYCIVTSYYIVISSCIVNFYCIVIYFSVNFYCIVTSYCLENIQCIGISSLLYRVFLIIVISSCMVISYCIVVCPTVSHQVFPTVSFLFRNRTLQSIQPIKCLNYQ